MAKCAAVILQTILPCKTVFNGSSNLYTRQLFSHIINNDVSKFKTAALFYSTDLFAEDVTKKNKVKVSRAMKAYLERARQHDEFLKEQLHQYNVGKRHLANMMGEDPETFTQEDVDKAIEYLFPSGLFEPKARPLLRHPDQIFPARKAAEFDESGRPHHFLFYTAKPNLYNVFFDAVTHMKALNDFEDKMLRKNLTPDSSQTLNFGSSIWLSQEELELRLVEKLTEKQYSDFLSVMDRLSGHPYAYRVKDFIEKWRKPLVKQSSLYDIPKPVYDADGRAYVTVTNCTRKSARGQVTVRSPGTGLITINNKSIEYFEVLQDREQVLFPLIFTDMIGKVDVEATVESGGPSGQSGVVRYGISMGLRSFVDQDTVERMKIAGLLQRDFRRRERKKPGQAGARRKYTWKKR